MLRPLLAALLLAAAWPAGPAAAHSRCIAFVEGPARILPAALPAATPVQAEVPEVLIDYVTHSTARITTPQGLTVATDYAGWAGAGPAPDIVTMNHAHETHYTDFPDPAIANVLRGWNPAGGPAEHHLHIGDLLVRNVPTDIRGWAGTVEKDGNSIFIFETADLCIGHLGHLHHKPTPEQFARIGRLDVVFAPVDGGLTLDLPTMAEVLKALRASIVIPVHYFGRGSLEAFLVGMSAEFDIRVHEESSMKVSLPGLPRQPTIVVLPGF